MPPTRRRGALVLLSLLCLVVLAAPLAGLACGDSCDPQCGDCGDCAACPLVADLPPNLTPYAPPEHARVIRRAERQLAPPPARPLDKVPLVPAA